VRAQVLHYPGDAIQDGRHSLSREGPLPATLDESVPFVREHGPDVGAAEVYPDHVRIVQRFSRFVLSPESGHDPLP